MTEERCPTCKRPPGAVGVLYDRQAGYSFCYDKWHDILRVSVRKEVVSPETLAAMERIMRGTTKEIP